MSVLSTWDLTQAFLSGITDVWANLMIHEEENLENLFYELMQSFIAISRVLSPHICNANEHLWVLFACEVCSTLWHKKPSITKLFTTIKQVLVISQP